MADSWMWWILTCAISLYFVMLLLDFNKPSKKLMEMIDHQETRHREMQVRLGKIREEVVQIKSRQEDVDLQMEELEQARVALLPEANKRRMTHVESGSFPMGGAEEDSPDNERPSHLVQLSSFYIDTYPVTNQDYREFVNCTGQVTPIHWQRGTYPAGLARHPVVNVSYHDAKAYADWMGARLPTEAEWEMAARGDDERLYPWGNRFVDGERCNAINMVGATLPVDEFPLGRSPFGVWDMSGNAYEWCGDYYEDNYYQFSPAVNPKGPEGGQERVIRGGVLRRDSTQCAHDSPQQRAGDAHARDCGFPTRHLGPGRLTDSRPLTFTPRRLNRRTEGK